MDGEIRLKGLKGTLSWREEGSSVLFQAQSEKREDGLYKVYITFETEEFLLGTLVPEQGGLYLKRRLSRKELEDKGWPILRGAEGRLAFHFESEAAGECWSPAGDLDCLLKDPVLLGAGVISGALICHEESGFRLAVPFDPIRPFPLVPLICLGREMKREGTGYLCFDFDRTGNPQIKKRKKGVEKV